MQFWIYEKFADDTMALCDPHPVEAENYSEAVYEFWKRHKHRLATWQEFKKNAAGKLDATQLKPEPQELAVFVEPRELRCSKCGAVLLGGETRCPNCEEILA